MNIPYGIWDFLKVFATKFVKSSNAYCVAASCILLFIRLKLCSLFIWLALLSFLWTSFKDQNHLPTDLIRFTIWSNTIFQYIWYLPLIEVRVSIKENERSCICVLGIELASFYDLDFGIVLTVWYFLLSKLFPLANTFRIWTDTTLGFLSYLNSLYVLIQFYFHLNV